MPTHMRKHKLVPMSHVKKFWAEVALHGGAVGLVLLYLGGYDTWLYLRGVFGREADMVPFLAFGLLAGLLLVGFFWAKRRGVRRNFAPIIIGVVLGMAFLALPDGAFPGKRIHISQYMILAFLAGAAFRLRLDGAALFVATALYVAVLGIHDEMLQGLHPSRYFAVRDVVVNALSGLAGTFVAYGFLASPADKREGRAHFATLLRSRFWPIMNLTMIGLSCVALVLAMQQFKGIPVPSWVALPLIVATGSWLLLGLDRDIAPKFRASGRLIVTGCALIAVYPMVSNVFQIEFN